MQYHHFKMGSIDTILNLIPRDCFPVSVDFEEAYYSVKISESFQRYLKLEFPDQIFMF